MVATIIIVLLIVAYSGWVIYKKVSDTKKGKFCGGCSGCSSGETCPSEKDVKSKK